MEQKTKAKDTKVSTATKKKKSKSSKIVLQKTENMKALAFLVKEIIETGLPKQSKGSKANKDVHPGVRSATNVINGLSSANCKIECYLSSYESIYNTHRKLILKSSTDLYWMTTIVVKAELGGPKSGVCLNLSMAMNSAMKMRKAIEEKRYSNPNDKDEAFGNYKYGYVTLLHYRLLAVIIDSLPEYHDDMNKLKRLLEAFKKETHLNSDESNSDDESDDDKPSLGKTVSELSGDKITSKGIENIIGSFANNASAFEKVKEVVSNMKATDGNPLENTELLTSTVTSIAPIFNSMFSDMANAQKKKQSSSSEEDSESDDESSD
jgi:hypothetical protein